MRELVFDQFMLIISSIDVTEDENLQNKMSELLKNKLSEIAEEFILLIKLNEPRNMN
jgi:hypothetical protein